jgi:5-methyltetrahydrofolate--homocysteine methyltransferase
MNRHEFRQILAERVLIMDGATGTELQKRGYLDGVPTPELLNITAPEKIQDIYRSYFEAGSDMVLANTFGANRIKLADYGLTDRLEEINIEGIRAAREVARRYNGFVAADVASLGTYLSPLGTISFDEAYRAFSEQVKILATAEPDLLVIETMAEIREVKAALLAAKENYSGPVIVQMTFTADGVSVTGTDLLSFLAVFEGLGADGLGMNCSVGPEELAKLAKTLAAHSTLPISFKPNAGMARLVNRETVFPLTP